MKNRHLLLIPLAFTVGTVIGHLFGDKYVRVMNGENQESRHRNQSKGSVNDPVYLRETKTSGHGL
ncbi:MAG: hypothetical protein LKI80_10340 [Sporolactobacillus sp.]|jgi:hypothetical protein|nr:hypothetical protein [Sporolactobacillus sp.]